MCRIGPTKNDTGAGEAQSAVLAAPLAPPEAARVRAPLLCFVTYRGYRAMIAHGSDVETDGWGITP